MRIRPLVITSAIPFVSFRRVRSAVIHIKGTTVNETKAKRTAATLGNFVVKVALRITDARQEVGTAEAARGPDDGGRGGRGEAGEALPTLHCGSERASEMKKKGIIALCERMGP